MAAFTILIILFNILSLSNGRRVHPKKAEDAWSPPSKTARVNKRWNPHRKAYQQLTLPDRNSHLVKSLPLLENPLATKHYAGHIPTTSTERQFFYWLFEAADNVDSAPLLIWLNGGPGCTSMTGLFMENGPFRFRNNKKQWVLEENPHSWHRLPANVLYIDQPVGTGFSFTTTNDYCSNDEEVNDDLYAFLQNFLKVHAELFVDQQSNSMNRNLWFSGESYAGHYIPSFINHLLQKEENIDSNKNDIQINIGGAAIGNGWINPYYQYSCSMASYSKGIIDLSQWAYLNSKEKQCQSELSEGHLNVDVCYTLLDEVIESSTGEEESNERISYYDTRILDGIKRFPANIEVLEGYFGNKDSFNGISPPLDGDISQRVLEAIHAINPLSKEFMQTFKECADPPYLALQGRDGQSAVEELKHILNHKDNIPILFFNGMDDLICNHVGNEILLNKLTWDHSKTWSTAKRYAWKISSSSSGSIKDNKNNLAGYVKSHHNLSFLKIANAGHMVPMDQPEVAFEMMKVFLTDPFEGFSKHRQIISQAEPVDFGICKKEERTIDLNNARPGRKILRKKRYNSFH